ncbi:MAG TPA: hypothetical protein VFR23_24405 [Jiangellaceae bacterium]|nr:hypothetical protein [Jiangellaceae bacterium]
MSPALAARRVLAAALNPLPPALIRELRARRYKSSEDPGSVFSIGDFAEANVEALELGSWIGELQALAPGESVGLGLVTITRVS